MATVRDLQSKAKKLLAAWRKDLDSGPLKKDRRSVLSHLCFAILARNNTQKNARAAEDALRQRFVDWNEIRVSPIAEVREVLETLAVPNAEAKAYSLRRFLRDFFGKYTKSNLNFDLIDVPEIIPPAEASEGQAQEDDALVDDEPVTRESGLPAHPGIPGFVDMNKVLEAPIPLEAKLINEKNGIHVASILWDDADRGPFAALWKAALVEELVEPSMEPVEALGRLRQVVQDKDMTEFAYYGVVYAQHKWDALSKQATKLREKAGKSGDEDERVPDERRTGRSSGRKKAASGK